MELNVIFYNSILSYSKIDSLNPSGNGPKNVIIALDNMQSPYKNYLFDLYWFAFCLQLSFS